MCKEYVVFFFIIYIHVFFPVVIYLLYLFTYILERENIFLTRIVLLLIISCCFFHFSDKMGGFILQLFYVLLKFRDILLEKSEETLREETKSSGNDIGGQNWPWRYYHVIIVINI